MEPLEVPRDIVPLILPSEALSITSFLRFPLPKPALANPFLSRRPEDWLSSHPVDEATFTLAMLTEMPIPPLDITDSLVHVLSTQLICAMQSITPLHLPDDDAEFKHYLPLWVPTYWQAIHQARRCRQVWTTALEWVDRKAKGSASGREAQKQLMRHLAHLSWSNRLHGKDVGYGQTQMLSVLLSDQQLTGAHICQLTARAKKKTLDRTEAEPWTFPHAFVAPEFVESLLLASRETTEDAIETERCYQQLRDLEHDLISGFRSTVSGVIFTNSNHFTCFVLDATGGILRFGDSLGGCLPSRIGEAFAWWMARLQAAGVGPAQKTNSFNKRMKSDLPITEQRPNDDFSCGILAVNALEHYHNPDVSLLAPDTKSIGLERLQACIDICKLHFEAVSASTSAEAAVTEQTFVHSYQTSRRSSTSRSRRPPVTLNSPLCVRWAARKLWIQTR